jgi:hypothetical protein
MKGLDGWLAWFMRPTAGGIVDGALLTDGDGFV